MSFYLIPEVRRQERRFLSTVDAWSPAKMQPRELAWNGRLSKRPRVPAVRPVAPGVCGRGRHDVGGEGDVSDPTARSKARCFRVIQPEQARDPNAIRIL